MFRDYEVEKHDHVDAIARDLGTTRKVIVEANHLKAPYGVRPGQHLKVPVAKAYVVQSGDTLAQVAKRFSLSPADLASLNGVSERGRLKAGERLALPADFHDKGPTRLKPTYVTEYRTVPAEPSRYRASAMPARTPPHGIAAVPAPQGPSPSVQTAVAPSPPAIQAYVAPRPAPPVARPPVQTTAPSRPIYAPPAQSYVPPPRPAQQAYAPVAPPQGRAPEAEPPAQGAAAITASARGRFIWPVRGEIISPFGLKGVGRRNDGIDIRARLGTVIQAAASGNVVYAGDQVPGFGNLVLVKHADGWVTAYAHLDRISVQMRQNIVQGQEVGQAGLTGGAVEAELHFEVRYAPTPTDRAKPVDPLMVLPR
ncbi:MAG TPA: peptidoglycan DD-metalloendopeptidase family protein [Caulobacteraceae bacterium]